MLLDGRVCCLRAQGDAEVPGDDLRTPFALATQSEGDQGRAF